MEPRAEIAPNRVNTIVVFDGELDPHPRVVLGPPFHFGRGLCVRLELPRECVRPPQISIEGAPDGTSEQVWFGAKIYFAPPPVIGPTAGLVRADTRRGPELFRFWLDTWVTVDDAIESVTAQFGNVQDMIELAVARFSANGDPGYEEALRASARSREIALLARLENAELPHADRQAFAVRLQELFAISPLAGHA